LSSSVLAGRVEEVHELDELGRAEAVHVHRRVALLDAVQKVQVPVERQLGVHTALHQHLRAADRDELADLLVQLLVLERVAVVVLGVAAEGAERALGAAHVGVVDVPVDDVRADLVAVDRPAPRVGPPPEWVERHAGQEVEPLLGRQSGFPARDRGQQAGVIGGELGVLRAGLVDGAAHGMSFVETGALLSESIESLGPQGLKIVDSRPQPPDLRTSFASGTPPRS
jgi:hypothetical protein